MNEEFEKLWKELQGKLSVEINCEDIQDIKNICWAAFVAGGDAGYEAGYNEQLKGQW